MENRLTEKRGGGKSRKEKARARNGGVEEAGNFNKNGPILYFSRNTDVFLESRGAEKQGNIITYLILSGLNHHYGRFSA